MFRMMFVASVAAFVVGSGAVVANAGPIPYPNPGTENQETYTFTATADGDIVAYFYGGAATYTEVVGLEINGVSTGVYGLNNHTSSLGDSIVLGNAHMGDVLTFVDQIIEGPPVVPSFWYSDPSLNSDGAQHIYSTSFAGSGLIPAGAYIGFEDLPSDSADLDYNDVQFVFTNVSSSVPEASTWALMLLGFLGLGFAGHRGSQKSSPLAA